ncbi:MAG: NUDIX domain-containing protein [Thermoplasmatota archaeon]
MKTEAVAFLLVKDGRFLAEKRRPDKEAYPGMLAVPGGRMEVSEDRIGTLFREMMEELKAKPLEYAYLCSLDDPEVYDGLTIHYYVVPSWEGEPVPLEAEDLEWIDLRDSGKIEVPIDRQAVEIFNKGRESF